MIVIDPSMCIVTLTWSQKPGQGLVDRVVDDFVDEMVQPRRARGPDVHRGTLPDRLEALENFYLVGAVILVDLIQRALLEFYALIGICHLLFRSLASFAVLATVLPT